MESKSLPVIVIPAYKPDQSLIQLIKSLHDVRPEQTIIVVDDGSGQGYSAIFNEISHYPIDLLHHPKNLGKGAALKTAFNHYLQSEKYQNGDGVVTADADGQHLVADILKVANALQSDPQSLHIGYREFANKKIPLRSKFGNNLTRFIFRMVNKTAIHDTQSGLRGIPIELMREIVKSHTHGYDFELEMLMQATVNKININEVSITTVYIDGNKSSHFNPIIDSVKIYFVFIRFASVSLISAGIDFCVFYTVFHLSQHIFPAILCGRMFSGSFNYLMNKKFSFHDQSLVSISGIKYMTWSIMMMVTSYFLIKHLYFLGTNILISKISVETLLYFLNFFIQRKLIFVR